MSPACPRRAELSPHGGWGGGLDPPAVQGLGRGWVWPCSVRALSSAPLPSPQKHPDFPKKPLTPYFRFFMEKRAKYAKLHPEMSNLDLTKILSKKYKELPEKKKVRRAGGGQRGSPGAPAPPALPVKPAGPSSCLGRAAHPAACSAQPDQ